MLKPTTKLKAAPRASLKSGVPRHVAIVMDGNRRWAKAHGLPAVEGHRAGYKALKKVADHAFDLGIKEMSVWAFSTENWDRPKAEVKYLMNFARQVFSEESEGIEKLGARIKVSGLKERVPADILEMIELMEERTRHNVKGILNFCFNYGGRADILEAVRKLIRKGITASHLTAELFSSALSTAGLHDVDLIIRTSEYRLSGFLPWESVYAEIYIKPDIYWPDFDERQFDEALSFFAARQRRFGK